jgi:hypothetical protein
MGLWVSMVRLRCTTVQSRAFSVIYYIDTPCVCLIRNNTHMGGGLSSRAGGSRLVIRSAKS